MKLFEKAATMKNFFLLRGLPGSGKSTWVYDNYLENITISSDQVRIDTYGFEEDENGILKISQKNAHTIWSMIRAEEERRMSTGEDIIIDSTMLKEKDMRAHEPLIFEYGYTGYVIDFTDVDFEICKFRNSNREEYRIVPDNRMEQMFETLCSNNVPLSYTIISPDEAIAILNEM